MKIATWNVNGIRARHEQLLTWLRLREPDVLCLQELKATPAQIPAALGDLDDYWCFWHGGPKGYSGVSLHLRKARFPTAPVFSHPSFDFENRIVVARIDHLHFASVYVPNGGKDFPAKLRFLEELRLYAAALHGAGGTLILCGDLNIARMDMDVHPKERKRVIGQLPEERALLEQILGTGLVDIGRALDPANDAMFTWWAPWRNMRARNIGWRLDYILATEALAATAASCPVESGVGTSDHAPVLATFAPG